MVEAEGLHQQQAISLKLMDLNGRVLRRQIIRDHKGTLQYEMERGELSDGLYLLELRQGSNRNTGKLILR
jgi:hypothetical protein